MDDAQGPDDLAALIAARRKALASAGPAAPAAPVAPDSGGDLASQIAERRKALASEPQAPLGERVMRGVGGAVRQLAHPVDLLTGMAKDAGSSLIDAVLSPGIGEARHDPRLSKGGNSSGRPIDLSPYDAEHGGITSARRNAAGAQTVANIAFPGIAGGVAGRLGGGLLAKGAGLAVAGGVAGATQSPDDPIAGGLTGAILAPTLGGLTHGIGKVVGGGVSRAADLVGRPMESRPLIRSAPFLGSLEGLTDRAARLNAPAVAASPPIPSTMKPMAPVDRGIPTQRLARGLKTSSPAAETVFRDALTPRAEGAVQRVIDHGLELTGLTSRENGLGVVDDLIAQRAQHGRENFQPLFEAHPAPINDPRLHAILKTPAGQQAAKRGAIIAANRGEPLARVDLGGGVPDGYSPDQWAQITKTMADRGMPVPPVPSGEQGIAPTLKQAHYIKLGFDDLLNSAPEPGSGGSGPNNAAAVRSLKNDWLKVLDKQHKEYAAHRKVFADESDLIRAAEVGRNLFKLHPQEAAKAFAEMPEAARQVARRTGFDALADRVENGPTDVERGTRKPRDVARMRLLFPDDASFATFQDGLKHEAQMHATQQGVLGGSVTSDKLADMADLAGVSLPDVFKAMRGNPLPLVAKGVKSIVSPRLKAGAERLSAERARLLAAGADGDVLARADATSRMAGKGGLMAAAMGSVPADRRPPPMKRLPPARWESGEVQGPAIPMSGQLPESRRLGPGPAPTPRIAGDQYHGTAMPIPQPIPLGRRLKSAGPTPTPTVGDRRLGPGIPTGGKVLDTQVAEEVQKIYRRYPEMAVSLTPEQQQRVESLVRARLSGQPDPEAPPPVFDFRRAIGLSSP